MTSHPVVVAMALALCLTFTSADFIKTKETQEVMDMVRQLVTEVRYVTAQAKSGIYLGKLRKNVLDLQTAASDLIGSLPGEVSECETQSVIKMAAAGTGSHEVLTVMLADDPLSMLNGRLSLSLAFLDHVVQLMEDELSLSRDVGPHLTAIVFGTNVTMDIVDSADKAVKSMALKKSIITTTTTINDHNNDHSNRVRRQLRTHVNLGRGWSVGLRGAQWDSRNGRYTFNARPTFSGFRPSGVRASFTIRF